jgi:ATP-dependent Clp protease adapter protein ClpS
MPDASSEISSRVISALNEDSTPRGFVIELLQSSFGKSAAEAEALTATIERQGRAICGTFPAAIADAVLADARRRIAERGYRFSLAAEAAVGIADGTRQCSFCGRPQGDVTMFYAGQSGCICDGCLLAGAERIAVGVKSHQFKFAHEALAWHFAGMLKDEIVSSSRLFPGHMRADVQVAIDRLYADGVLRLLGIYEEHRYETVTIATLLKDDHRASLIAPLQYSDLDIGEADPVKCLDNGLWLCRDGDLRYAVLLTHHREYGNALGVRVEIAVPAGERGSALTQRCFRALEAAINASRAYRGKILSLEENLRFQGSASGITVHRLATVARDEVILPAATLALLERNVLHFVGKRDRLRGLGQPTKKGILLYGPPGTGKTHTIRYLAGTLAGHTTLIMAAEQVGLLGQYMSLARLLQPSLVIIEDVDLIARTRTEMGGPCEEVLLNKLLNEMDGLKEDADIVFVLTTNRPQDLEAALAARPGRVDQAIEVPVPDAAGRDKLIRLYGKALSLPDAIVTAVVQRTEGVSAAFIKELMRRTAQASLERQGDSAVTLGDANQALDDMLFTGGRLNSALLGGQGAVGSS